MPAAVAAAVASWFAGATVTSLATAAAVSLSTAFVYGAAYLAATVAIGAGLGAMGRAVAPGLGTGSLTQGSPIQMTRNPVTPRRVIYGQTRVSGAMVFAQVSGTKNEFLHLVVALAGHECDSIGDIYFNDTLVPLDGSGNATGTYAGLVRVKKHLGTDTQAADSDLVAESGGLWTTNHRLRGIAYIYVRLKYDTNVMPGGMPNVSAVVKGRKVFDPRDSSTAWSANASLCTRDYLTNQTFGLAFDGATEIDDASFISSANVDDEAVSLAAGGTEPRNTVNGTFDTTADPASVLNALTGARAGWVVFIGGKCICGGGAHQTPSITLSESDLRAPLSVQTKMSMRDTCNRVKGTFLSPADLWQPADFPEVSNGTYLSEDGGIQIWRDLQLGFTTSASAAQRLAKIELERTRQDIVVTMPCKLMALTVQPGDVVMVNNTRFGWSAKEFLVTDLKFSVYNDQGAPALGVDLTLRETASAVWDWSSGEETIYDPAPNTNLPNPWAVAAPTGIGLTVTSFRQPDRNLVPQLQVSWTAPAEQFVQSGGAIRIQYKKHTDSLWSEAAPVKGDQAFTYIFGLLIGTAYDVQIRAESNLGVASAWTQSLNFTMTADTTPPGAPTGLAAVVGTGKSVSLSWMENAEADFDHRYAVYRFTSNTPSSGVQIATNVSANRFVDVNVAIGTTYWYWITAFDQTNNESSKSSGISATPATVPSGSLDHTVPSDPTAATQTGNGTYQGTDGMTAAYEQFSVPAMPSGAAGQNFLMKRHSDSQWLIVGQFTNGSTMTGLRVPELTPGQQYDFATEAYNAFGDFSNVVATTGNPFTAPGDTTLPAAPSGFSVLAGNNSGAGIAPRAAGNPPAQLYACRVSFTPSTSDDIDFYECQGTLSDTDGAASAVCDVNGSEWPIAANTLFFDYYAFANSTRYLRVRGVDFTGNRGSWARVGEISASLQFPSGNLIEQNKSDVQISAVKTGDTSASSVRQVRTSFPTDFINTFAGGAPTEDFNVSLTNRGFFATPDAVTVQCIDPAGNLDAAYKQSSGSNSSTNIVITAYTRDGTNISAGARRFSLDVIEYT